jgi:hypothetical protein
MASKTYWRASVYHRGKRVSRAHSVLLAEYERHHGAVYANQGRRTLAEQAAFYATYLRYGHPLAAKPYPGAPHIKWNQANHALDINAPQPAHSVADFYRSKGIPVAFNVAGEAWHMDTLDEGKLIAAAEKIHGRDPVLRKGSRGSSVVTLKKLLYKKGIRNFSGKSSSNRYVPLFSGYTKSAVQRFQKAHKLKADGVVGPATWKALRK